MMDRRIEEEKKALRLTLREKRAEASRNGFDAAAALRDLFLSGVSFPSSAAVASYAALDGEMDADPLNEALLARGHALGLPCVAEKKSPLIFRAYMAGDPLCLGPWDIPEPVKTVPALDPDLLLVPLLGFDRRGARLGQGGGYYDRTLAALRARKKILAVGLAFAAQECPSLPLGPDDQKLDMIVTEREVIDPVS